MGFFPVDAETVRYLRAHGTRSDGVRAGRALQQGAGALPHRCHARSRVHRHARARPEHGDAQPGRPEAAAGPGPAAAAQAELHRQPARPHERQRARRTEGAGPERVLALDGRGRRQRHDRGRRGGGGHRRRRGGRSRRAADRLGRARRLGHHPARRCGGHRGHHELHQHLEPVGDDRRGSGGPEGGRARPRDQAMGQDQPGARLPGGDRLPRGIGAAALPRAAPVQHRRLRLHHLHREQRPAARGDRAAHRRALPGHRGRAERQPELRGAGPPAGARQLPGLPDAGGGVRAGRSGGHRPHPRAARHGEGRAPGLPRRTSGPRRRRSGTRWSARSSPSCSSGATARSSTATRSGRRSGSPRAAGTPGTRHSTYVQEPPFFIDLPAEPAPLRDITDARVLAVLGRLGDDRPHLAGGLDPQERTGRPLPARARRGAGRLEHFRLPARAITR